MALVKYAGVNKFETEHQDNYTQELVRDRTNEKTDCYGCIFCGENENVSERRLCARYINEIAEVQGIGTCDAGKSRFHWYNQVGLIKKRILEATGFKFKNR
nr:hypothetical protein [Candidatus Enterousia merdequi]